MYKIIQDRAKIAKPEYNLIIGLVFSFQAKIALGLVRLDSKANTMYIGAIKPKQNGICQTNEIDCASEPKTDIKAIASPTVGKVA